MEELKEQSAERRRFPRLTVAAAVDYVILNKQTPEEGTLIRNISAGGICLIVYENIDAGTVLSLSIFLPDNHSYISAKGRVVWKKEFMVSSEQRKRYDVGVEFIEISEEDQKRISKFVFSLLK